MTSPAIAAGLAAARHRTRAGGGRRPPRERSTTAVLIVTVVILAVAVVYPTLTVLVRAFSASGTSAISTTLLRQGADSSVLANTVILGVSAGVLGTIIGFCFAYAHTVVGTGWKRFLHVVALVPLISPAFAVATAVITMFGRRGLVTSDLFGLNFDIYGFKGLVFVEAFTFSPLAYMSIRGPLESLNPSLNEAAADLGSSRLGIFVRVTLPLLRPALIAAFLLIFVEAIADLANPLVLGGDFTVLASRVYSAVIGQFDLGAASGYAIVLLVPAFVLFVFQRYWMSRKSLVTVTGKPSARGESDGAPSVRVVVLAIVIVWSALVILLYAAIVVGGFVNVLGVDNTPTLDNYRFIAGAGADALYKTPLMAGIATPIAVGMAVAIAWLAGRKMRRGRAALDFAGMLPLAVPGTVFGLGYAMAFSSPIKIGSWTILPALAGGSGLAFGAFAIVLVYAMRGIPAGQQAVMANLGQIDRSIDEAASSLGVRATQSLRKVTAPLVRPAISTAITYAIMTSMTNITAIIFITTPQTKVVTSQILDQVDAGRYGTAFAFCTILIVMILLMIGIGQFILGLANRRSVLRRR